MRQTQSIKMSTYTEQHGVYALLLRARPIINNYNYIVLYSLLHYDL